MRNSDPVVPFLREQFVGSFGVLSFVCRRGIFPKDVRVRFVTGRTPRVGRTRDIPLHTTLFNAHPCKVLVHHVVVKSPTSVLVGAEFLNGGFCVGVGAKDLFDEA